MIRCPLGALSLVLLALASAQASDGKAEVLERQDAMAARFDNLRGEAAAIRNLIATNVGAPETVADRLIGPGDDIAAAFGAAEAGETLVVRGHHRITRALPLRDDMTIYLDGGIIDGSLLLDPAKWKRSGGLWRQPIPDAQGSGKCFCGGEERYLDDKLNPLATEREKLLVDGRFIFEVEPGKSRQGKWWRHVNGQAEINFDPAGHVIEVTHAEYIFDRGAKNVRIVSDSPERGVIRGAATPVHRGMINGLEASVGWTLDSITIEDSAAIGARLNCGLIRNAVIRENGQAGVTGQGKNCVWPDGAAHGKWFNSVVDSEIYDNNAALFKEEWEAAGVKLGLGIKACRVAGNRVWGNHATALWVDNRGGGSCVFENNLIWGNARSGLHAEYQAKQPGHDYAFLARNNIVVDNAPQGSYRCNKAGAMVRKQPDAAFLDNLFVLTGQANGFCIKHGSKAELNDSWFPHRNVVKGNIFVFMPGNRKSLNGPWSDRSEGIWRDFGATIEGNTYVVQTGETPALWLLDESEDREDADGERRATWSEWRNEAGFDRSSELKVVDNVLDWLRAHYPDAEALLH